MVAIVFFGFLAVGIPIAALSLEVHHGLGFSALVVGLVIGSQSAATVLVRHHAGTVADQAGPRKAVLLGLPAAALSGVLYMASVALPLGPTVSLPTEENKQKLAEFDAKIDAANKEIEAMKQAQEAGFDAWKQGLSAPDAAAPIAPSERAARVSISIGRTKI